MASFGVDGVRVGDDEIVVAPRGATAATDLTIEPDASSASYPLAHGRRRRWSGPGARARTARRRRATSRFADLLGAMGCTVDDDGGGIAVSREPGAAAHRHRRRHGRRLGPRADAGRRRRRRASTPTTITGVGFIRAKESDRLGDLAAELGKLGAAVTVEPDGLRIEPAGRCTAPSSATHHDHRLAMAFGVLGAVVPGHRGRRPGRRLQELAGLLGGPRRHPRAP